jgi:xanthine dehydrogenase accessory factor
VRELLPAVEQWRRAGHDVALATVVSVAGSAPRGVGAKMAVAANGEMAGSVSGGCVEVAVRDAALAVLASGEPRLLRFGIADELGLTVGLSCGGEIEVFVEPAATARAAFAALEGHLRAERPVAAATAVRGGTVGAKLLVLGDGATEQTLGDADLDRRVAADAVELLSAERSATRTYPRPGVGEDVEVLVDVFPREPTLVVVGGSDTAIALSRIVRVLGFRVVVIDARGVYATRERFPEADEVVVRWPDEAIGAMRVDGSTYVVVLTHDPKLDEPALTAALATEARYVGAVGSRKTAADRARRLAARGLSAEQIARIHGPIGLDLGANTPQEVALSIAAEMVAARHNRRLARVEPATA